MKSNWLGVSEGLDRIGVGHHLHGNNLYWDVLILSFGC